MARRQARSARAFTTRRRRIAPRDTRADLTKVLQYRWVVFLRQTRRCKRQSTEPAVHDLRVATRRLIAALDVLAAVIPERQVGKTRMQLKNLLKMMSPLRDTQVQLLAVRRLLPRFPELEPYGTVLLMRELRSLGQISRRLARLRPLTLGRQVRDGTRNLDRLMRRPETRAAADLAMRGAFASAFARVATMRNQIIRTDPGSIHRMRVSFKKFRYATEIVGPEMTKGRQKAMNNYQTRMGDIHDVEVLLAGLQSFTREYPVTGSLQRVRRYLRRQLATKLTSLMKSMNDFRRFYDAGVPT